MTWFNIIKEEKLYRVFVDKDYRKFLRRLDVICGNEILNYIQSDRYQRKTKLVELPDQEVPEWEPEGEGTGEKFPEQNPALKDTWGKNPANPRNKQEVFEGKVRSREKAKEQGRELPEPEPPIERERQRLQIGTKKIPGEKLSVLTNEWETPKVSEKAFDAARRYKDAWNAFQKEEKEMSKYNAEETTLDSMIEDFEDLCSEMEREVDRLYKFKEELGLPERVNDDVDYEVV